MNSSMAVSHAAGGHGRQQSITKPSPLYASRMKSPPPPLTSLPASTSSDRQRPPQLSPMPISPRWDSLANGSRMLLQSPMSPLPPRSPSQNSWYDRYGQLDEASPHHQPQQPAAGQHHRQLHAPTSMPARDMATARGRLPAPLQLDSSSALMTKSMRAHAPGRTPETPAVENFSRPRKQSIRSPPVVGPGNLRLASLPPSDRMPEMTSVSPSSTPSWQRPRRPSASSKSSLSYAISPSFPPTAEHFESTASRSSRGTSAQLAIAGHRPQLGHPNRIDSPASVAAPGGPTPWMSDDELRSSYRSQLTSSSAFGTALTERSSVLTKDSSVLSLYGHEADAQADAQAEAEADADADADEPSLEDVMGMYERGFCDDDDDYDYNNHNSNTYQNDYFDPPHSTRNSHDDYHHRHQPSYDHHHYPYDDQYNTGYGAAPYGSYPHEAQPEFEQPEVEQPECRQEHPQESEEEDKDKDQDQDQQQERQQEPEPDLKQEHGQEHGQEHRHSVEHGHAPLPTHEEEATEEDTAETDADDVPDNMISVMHRPTTSRSEPGPERIHSEEFSADPVPQVPATHSALDMEIRQSKMLFSSAAFTSTVPALTHDHDLDHDPEHDLEFPEKRDSSRTVESNPSLDSDGVRTDARGATPSPSPSHISPPSMPESRSVSPSPSVRLPVPEPEKPGSRDRYGFKKENQFITRQQYDAWDKVYSQYLARRRKKWTSYLKDSALMTDRPQRFPAPNAKTKRFVRKGIPPDWRGAAWFYYAGGPAILAKHGGLYDKLLLRQAKHVDIEAIERDLHRTFPDNIQFKPSQATADMLDTTTSSERASQSTVRGAALDGSGPGPVGLEGEPPLIASLRRVLLAFAVYNPRIGYCQSLNFIAGLLLLFVDTEEQAFWLLNVITHIYLPGTHEMSLEGSKVDLGVLMTELRDTMPAVWDKIGGELDNSDPQARPMTSKSVRNPLTPRLKKKDTHLALSSERLPPITLCMTAWFMSCYIGTLPIETTLRVWDVFFYEGSKTLFRVALAIFKLGEAEIKAIADPMEMFGVVQSMPRKMLDANKVLETCFKRRNGFNHLSQEVIEERRQERRDKAQQDLLLRSRSKAATTGATGKEADGERKGGSLFGLVK
ncbi:hypothetical protein J3F83DRAFT_3431 [Trichoderma novae-zelandiae]